MQTLLSDRGYSTGGVDSAYLLHAAREAGADVKPYFVKTPFQPAFELEDARTLAPDLTVIDVDILQNGIVVPIYDTFFDILSFIAGPMIFGANYLPIDRENPREAMKTINAAAELLKNDVVSVGVYPEGTRGRDADMLPFHNGVFKIAQKAKVPIAVISVRGTEKLGANFPLRHTDVYLDVAAVLEPDSFAGLSSGELSQRVRTILEERLQAPAPGA